MKVDNFENIFLTYYNTFCSFVQRLLHNWEIKVILGNKETNRILLNILMIVMIFTLFISNVHYCLTMYCQAHSPDVAGLNNFKFDSNLNQKKWKCN